MGVDELTDYLASRYKLSPAQKKVLYYVLRGYDNPEIAEELGKSKQTIKNQITEIFGKMETDSRNRIQAMAIEYLCGEENEDVCGRQKK